MRLAILQHYQAVRTTMHTFISRNLEKTPPIKIPIAQIKLHILGIFLIYFTNEIDIMYVINQ